MKVESEVAAAEVEAPKNDAEPKKVPSIES